MSAITERVNIQDLLAYCHIDPFQVAQAICEDIVLSVKEHNETELKKKLVCLQTVLVQCKGLGEDASNTAICADIFDKVAMCVCIPLFKQKTGFCRCTTQAMQLIELIHSFVSSETLETLFTELRQSLDSISHDSDPETMSDIEAGDAVQILSRLFSKNDTTTDVPISLEFCMERNSILSTWRSQYIAKVLQILPVADDKLFSSLSTKLLPTLLRMIEHGERVNHLDAVWALIWGIFNAHRQEVFNPNRNISRASEQPHALICALADWFFSDIGSSAVMTKLLCKTEFWVVLQSGFYHSNSLTRKQSMYTLKRILDTIEKNEVAMNGDSMSDDVIFWWHPEAKKDVSKVWTDFILLMETLEEKQTHVIKPLMSRLDNLFKATIKNKQGRGLLHTSWITSLLQRIACHESMAVRRWGVVALLAADYVACPFFEQQLEFFSGPLVVMLTESSVYYKSSESPKDGCCPLVTALVQFFASCQHVLEQQRLATFLEGFLHSITQHQWNGSALFYVTYALSQIKQTPVWGPSAINDIGCLLRTTKQNLDPYTRGAIQCSLMKSLMHLVNTDEVSVDDFANVLALLPSDESIKRGSSLWAELAQWLPQMAKAGTTDEPSHLWQYIETSLAEMTNSSSPENSAGIMSQQKHVAITRLLLLMCDSGLLPRQPGGDEDALGDTLHGLLSPVLSVIWSVKFHPYVSTRKAETAMAFLVTLVDECRVLEGSAINDVVNRMVSRLVENSSEGLLLYGLRRIPDIKQIEDLPSVHLCCRAVHIVGDRPECSGIGLVLLMARLVNACMKTLHKFNAQVNLADQLPCHAAMMFLGTICETFSNRFGVDSAYDAQVLSFLKQWKSVTHFGKSSDSATDDVKNQQSQKAMGRLMSEFLSVQWSAQRYLLRCASLGVDLGPGGLDNVQYASDCLDTLDLTGGEHLVSVFHCFTDLMPKLEGDLAVRVMSATWRKVKESLKTPSFWPLYELYVQLAFHPCNLTSGHGTPVSSYLSQNAQEILSFGEERRGLVNTLATQVCRWWEKSPSNLTYASNYSSLILEFCLWGNANNKGLRLMEEAHSFVTSLGHYWSVNQLIQIETRSDRALRVMMLTMFSKLHHDVPEHCAFANMMIEELMATQRHLVAVKTYRNFPNCCSHLRKHRVCCALLVLDVYVTEEQLEVFWLYLLAMLSEEVQPSIRCLTEWLIVRVLQRRRSLLDHIWTTLLQCTEKKAAFLCSLLTILSQVAKTTEDHHTLTEFCHLAIPRVLPWCSSHHFNLRVYAHATLITLWSLCKRNQLELVLTRYCLIESLMEFNEENSNAQKVTEKLLDNFFFKFHAVQDYSIETIVHTLPYLTLVTEDEWLKPQLFSQLSRDWQVEGAHSLPLRSESAALKQCKPGAWRVRVTDQEGDSQTSVSGDVQKKMIPWSAMLPQLEETDSGEEVTQSRRPGAGQLVLVTSLIHKIPNLGGLCRTCEIFGVSEFVIANLMYVADKTFQSLSVTAHKWLPIREVKEHSLKVYLEHMKGEGYTLVGVEQTAHSKCLTQYHFPRKTLLLLGNEKEGIPADLIQLLDVCVEIPQQGVIRSLNVHVSGALLVWEYTRQQLSAHTSPLDGQQDVDPSVSQH